MLKLTPPSGRAPLGQAAVVLPDLRTAQETAERLKVSVSWLAKRRMDGDGPPYIKIGRSVRYPEPGLVHYAKSRQRLSTSEA